MEQEQSSFEDVRSRLEQIVDEVNAEGISLDDALKLYEEAVKLGLSACDLSENDIFGQKEAAEEAPEEAEEAVAEEVAEAAIIEHVGDAASVQIPETPEFTAQVEVEGDGPATYPR